MTKSELRKTFLARQSALAPAERLEKSRQIADKLFANFDLTAIRFLHCFIPIEKFNEIDTSFIFRLVWKEYARIETLVPRVNFETGEIESLRFGLDTQLVPNSWGISEPVQDEPVSVGDIDMVVVPGVAFDAIGHRVGYGKGFYDRFLSRCSPDCVKAGLSYFEPVERIAGIHAGDIKLDWLVTPERIMSCR